MTTLNELDAMMKKSEPTPPPTEQARNNDLTPQIKQDTSTILEIITKGGGEDPVLKILKFLIEKLDKIEKKIDGLAK